MLRTCCVIFCRFPLPSYCFFAMVTLLLPYSCLAGLERTKYMLSRVNYSFKLYQHWVSAAAQHQQSRLGGTASTNLKQLHSCLKKVYQVLLHCQTGFRATSESC
jgi:hypothetical protein